MIYSTTLYGKGRNTTLKEDIKQSLFLIIFTGKGERIYLPGYGADALSYLDKPQWEWQRLIVSIAESVKKYEARVSIDSLEVVSSSLKDGIIAIQAVYEIISTGELITESFTNK